MLVTGLNLLDVGKDEMKKRCERYPEEARRAYEQRERGSSRPGWRCRRACHYTHRLLLDRFPGNPIWCRRDMREMRSRLNLHQKHQLAVRGNLMLWKAVEV